MTNRHDRIALLRKLLSPAAMAERVRAAEERERLLVTIESRVREGLPQCAARDELCPGEPMGALNRDLRLWREYGLDGLIDARRPPTINGIPSEAKGLVQAIGKVQPDWSVAKIRDHLEEQHEICASLRAVRVWLQRAGLTRKRVERPKSATKPTPPTTDAPTLPAEAEAEWEVYRHPFAGAEILKGVDLLHRSVEQIAEAVSTHARNLPMPPEVRDDRGDRDGRGRFRPSYNRVRPRRFARLGAKFESVRLRRQTKNPRTMKIAQTSVRAIAAKLMALVMAPIAVAYDLQELAHGLYAQLGRLVGFAYRPATLDKFKRELKYAEVADLLSDQWLHLLRDDGGEVVDSATGAVLLFGDATTRELHTRHFTRSLKVSARNRVVPGMETLTLNSGGGSILQYSVHSGHVAIHKALPALMTMYERTFGPAQVDRVLVVDREGHAREFFQAIASKWKFIISLRSNVTGPNAQFRNQTEWMPFPDGGEICEAELLLRAKRKADQMWVRVVGLRRHPKGSTQWLATNTAPTPFTPVLVVQSYFQRWPCQEHRFRDGKGRVGLQRQQGYGKEVPDRVAVLKEVEVLQAEVGTLVDQIGDVEDDLRWLNEQKATTAEQVDSLATRERRAIEALRAVGDASQDPFIHAAKAVADLGGQLQEATSKLRAQEEIGANLTKSQANLRAALGPQQKRLDKLLQDAETFVVDRELDEIMMLPKALFLEVCMRAQRSLLHTRLETDTLIRRVLQLPGELHVRKDERRVVIYRNPDDPEISAAVEGAVARLAITHPALCISMADPPGDRIR